MPVLVLGKNYRFNQIIQLKHVVDRVMVMVHAHIKATKSACAHYLPAIYSQTHCRTFSIQVGKYTH